MEMIATVATAMQTVLTTAAERAARASGCVRRVREFTGPTLVQTLVFGWLAAPAATTDQLCQTAALLGVTVSPQGLAQRFTAAAADCLRRVLEAAVSQVVATDPVALPLLNRFPAVFVQDSTTIGLPAALADLWRGCGNATGQGEAALKAHVRLDLTRGALTALTLTAARTNDRRAQAAVTELPPGALLLEDMGYFAVATLAAFDEAGVYWIQRPPVTTGVAPAGGERGDWVTLLTAAEPVIDVPVQLGAAGRLRCRLVGVRAPAAVAAERRRKLHAAARDQGKPASAARLALAEWTYAVTNVPAARLTTEEALVLLRARWQIELVFRRWKSLGQVDAWRSRQPWRILCEVYAKLLGMVVQHWVVLTGAWANPDRSLWQAAQVVQGHALHLAAALHDGWRTLQVALVQVARPLARSCRLHPHPGRRATYQLLGAEELT